MSRRRSRKELIESSSESSDSDDFLESSEESDSDSEPKRAFCKCGENNTKHMIGCDGLGCLYEWLHFKCVGIDPENIPKGIWLCEDCQSKKSKPVQEDYRMPSGQFVVPVADPIKENIAKEEKEDLVPSGQFVWPVSDSNKLNNSKKEEEHHILSCQDGLPVPNPSKQNTSETETDQSIPTDLYILPNLKGSAEKKADKTSDSIMVQSLNKAEQQVASNLRQACNAVIYRGWSIGDAAQQFHVGRYFLGDCVKEQQKLNLTKACESVISHKYTVERAALIFGVIPGILEERVKAVQNLQCTTDGQKMTAAFVENLQQACIAVMTNQFTADDACRTYRVHPETLKNKIKSLLMLTTTEENDLVKMCVRMAVLGQSADIKSTAMSKIKELLDKEEIQGIKRMHSFPDNMPDNFWWECLRRRHPEFKAISSLEETHSKPVASTKSNSDTSPQTQSAASSMPLEQVSMQPSDQCPHLENVGRLINKPPSDPVSSGVILKQVSTQPSVQSSSLAVGEFVGASNIQSVAPGFVLKQCSSQPSIKNSGFTVSQLVGTPIQNSGMPVGQLVASAQSSAVNIIVNQLSAAPPVQNVSLKTVRQLVASCDTNLAASGAILNQLSTQPTIQTPDQKTVLRELRPKPPVTDEVYIIMPKPRVNKKQSVSVPKGSPPDSRVTPIAEAVTEEVGTPKPDAAHKPVYAVDMRQSLKYKQSLDSISHTVSSRDPSLLTADTGADQPNLDGCTTEINDSNLVMVADEETQQPSSVIGASELVLPSLDVASHEVVQTEEAVSIGVAQFGSVTGANELLQMSTVVADDEGAQPGPAVGGELSLPNVISESNEAVQFDQLGASEVVETSLESDNVVLSDGAVPNTEALQPDVSVSNEDPNEAVEPLQETGATETVVAANTAQPSVMATSNGVPHRNEATPMTNVVHIQPKICFVANQAVQPYFVSRSPLFVNNEIIQPSQVVLAKKIAQPNLVTGSNQILPQNRVATTNRIVESNPVGSLPTSAKLNQGDERLTISNKDLQAYLNVTGGNVKDIPFVFPKSCDPAAGKPSPELQMNSNSNNNGGNEPQRMFLSKYKIDKTLPDPLSCLEKTLTEEQKELFAFRLQIGDNRQDDTLYNAWRALKRLYHHKNIYSLYNKKAPHVDQVPANFDLPLSTKLLKSPLMDPAGHGDGSFGEKSKRGWMGSEQGSKVLAELHWGRKRRRISAVLARREADRRRTENKPFLEPWKHQIKRRNKRKRFVTMYAGDSLLGEECPASVAAGYQNHEKEIEMLESHLE